MSKYLFHATPEHTLLIHCYRFCAVTKRDPKTTLMQCGAPIFKGYLYWRCKNSRIKKESSITTYWKVLSMFLLRRDEDMDGRCRIV